MSFRYELAMLYKHWRHFRWRAIPLWIQTYLAAMLLVNTSISLAAGLLVYGTVPATLLGTAPGVSADDTLGGFVSQNLGMLIGFLLTFAASTGAALWRLQVLERDTATKDSLKSGLELLSKDHELLREMMKRSDEERRNDRFQMQAIQEAVTDAAQAIARLEGGDRRQQHRR